MLGIIDSIYTYYTQILLLFIELSKYSCCLPNMPFRTEVDGPSIVLSNPIFYFIFTHGPQDFHFDHWWREPLIIILQINNYNDFEEISNFTLK